MPLATLRPRTDCNHTCSGPVTLRPPSVTSFRRTDHHHHHYRHHPTANSSLSGQTQAIWNGNEVHRGVLHELLGQYMPGSAGGGVELWVVNWAGYDEGSVNGHDSTAFTAGRGGAGATSSATYSLPAWEMLEWWGSEVKGQWRMIRSMGPALRNESQLGCDWERANFEYVVS